MAREKLLDAKKAVAAGRSPALEKQREKRRLTAAKSFGDVALKWLTDAKMADSARAMPKHVVDRDILPVFQNRLLNEITGDDLRALCHKVKARGAPATAVHVRDIVKQVYAFAVLHGERVDNPANDVAAASIATFVPKDRALSPTEFRLAFHQLESIATLQPAAAPTTAVAQPQRYLTNDEAAAYLRLSPRTLEKQRVIGGGPKFRKFGRRVMYAVADLDAWAAGRSFETTSDPAYADHHAADSRAR